MCGRYASFRDAQDLADELAIADLAEDARLLPPSWNVAPRTRCGSWSRGRPRTRARSAARCGSRGGARPELGQDPGVGARMINARSESLLDKPPSPSPSRPGAASSRPTGTTSGAASRLPGPGFHGAQAQGLQAAVLHPPRRAALAAFAGLYEFWRDPTKGDDDPTRWLVSTTIITTDAAPALASIHDRMPLALPGPVGRVARPCRRQGRGRRAARRPRVGMSAQEVAPVVNSVANNGPELIRAV
ncbi:SOS response-associated peptidase family protein [Oerskovia sp. M15]